MFRRARIVLGLAALVGAALASASAGQGPPGGSPPGLDKAIAAKEKHAARMLDKPGVAGIGVGLNKAGKPVIEIYKEKPDVADLPGDLEGIPVESVTTGVIEPRDHAPTHEFPRPVPIGVSAGLAGVATGTLGARVVDGSNNVYALSNNHVFAGVNTASIGDPIISPGDVDGGSDPGDRIGTLAAFQTINFSGGTNTMDAAIAATSTADVGTATPVDGYGTPSPITAPAFIGQAVQKYGRTTGLQAGSVAGTNVSVDVCYIAFGEFCLQEARFAGQISISPGPFSAPGDSGSLVVTQGGNQPVGLLFAGGDGLTIATPIDLVLQRFGVTIDGSSPPDGPPSAPTGLTAVAGTSTASLSWNAPTFDGGSPLTGYRVYRGTSPNPTTALTPDLGVVTSFQDSGLTNGQTYYYKVSALNANGEGPLSSEASATPTDLVPPEPPVVLDDFNRANESPLSDGGKWSNGIIGASEVGLNVTSNALACAVTTTCTAWRNNAQFGPNAEAWAKISTLPGTGNAVRLYVRLQTPGSSAFDGYMLRTNQLAGTDEVFLERQDNGALVRLLTMTQELAVGNTLLLRAKGTILEAWLHDGSSWSRLGVVSDATYGAIGRVGIGLRGTTGRLDDFGARTLGGGTAPSAPLNLAASAGDTQVSLTWSTPSSDGGSALTGYRVYRGTSPNPTSALTPDLGLVTSFQDSGLTNGQTYYYKVSALNAVGESPLSNEASATPTELVPPAPLVALDDFNRPNESPLSGGGTWGNGVIGPVETGLNVSSNQLACSKTTTCTGWRSNAQYGPDVEAYARLSALPGTNNGLRLYVRLKDAGAGGYDGYMLRTSQQTGMDQVFLERADNGVLVSRLTMSQELAAGDTMLLRAIGQAIEVWRHDGSSWSRLGIVFDSTYAAAGFVGVGIRGTTGRLDDFGGRTFGVTATAPSAPLNLAASAGDTQVSLTWSTPSSDGGSAITGYRVYRGTSPNPTVALTPDLGVVTSFQDSG
ncbi:MAG: fibronectin type III domain-containing protein, partial [Gaiellaceae bacterium]